MKTRTLPAEHAAAPQHCWCGPVAVGVDGKILICHNDAIGRVFHMQARRAGGVRVAEGAA